MACCNSCGHAYEREANFCSRCGRPTTPLASGDRRVVTVLFADVSGFTRLSETLDPERLTEIINACFKALSEPIYRFGGIVDKYIGDAIMALFGAPVTHEDDAERAVSAAYAMQRAAERFSERLEAETGIRLRMRIGLNTGLVVAGAIGGDQKQDYTVMGDAVNLAQRLESQAEPGSILVSGQTYRLTAHAFSYQSARKLFVKGRQEAVYAYELKGPLLEAPPQADRPPFVGRGAELDRLHKALHAAAKGKPQWIMLMGGAGTGKSRLAREAIATLPPDPRRLVIEARGQTYHAETSLSLLRQIVEGLMAPMVEGDHLDRLEAGLEARAVPEAQSTSRKLAFFLGVEGGDPMGAREALAGVIARMEAPLILLLEDLHRIDADSAAWLSQLAGRLDGGTLAVVCELREPLPLSSSPWLSPLTLTLGPLDVGDAWQLILAELKASRDALEPSARRLLEAALARAEGNPMFLRELVHGWIDAGVLQRKAGRWLAEPRESDALPTSINAILAARLDQLTRPHREVLQAAAALEGPFSLEMLSTLLESPDLDGALAELARRDLLQRGTDGKWHFSQSLVQEVTYQTMLLSQRRALHQRIAEVLEGLSAGVEVLARHYRLAGDAHRAVPLLQQAATRAQRRAAHAEACLYLRQALSISPDDGARELSPRLPSPRADLLRSLAESEAVLGNYTLALEAAFEARNMLVEPLAIAQTERTLGNLYERTGDYSQAATHYGEAIRQAPDEALRCRVQLDLAWLALRQGDHDACLEACCQVLRSPAADAEAQEMALSLRGVAYDRLGRWSDAVRSHGEALRGRMRRRDRFGIASSLNNLGMALTELGDWQAAERMYRRSLRLYERIGELARGSAVRNNLGDLAARRGDLDAAERQHRDALGIREKLGDRFGIGASRCALGWVLALRGDLDEGGRLIREGVEILEEIGERELLAEAYQALGRIALEARRYPEAEVKLAQALGLSQFDRNPLQRAIVHRLRGQLLLEWGDMAGARSEIAEAQRVLEGLSHPLERARTMVLRSRLLRAEGSYAEAEAMLGEAIALFERLGARLDLASLTPASVTSGSSPQILCADSLKPKAR
jgi:class 3 adenylate cyclase/tetratricopeptide (TPR) repeat protein